MPSRRLLAGLPLAIAVAIAAHAITFGADHTLGGSWAPGLAALLAIAAFARCVTPFVRALVGHQTIAPKGELGNGVLGLACAAAFVYAGIEVAEGRSALAAGLVPLLLVVPLAFVASAAARRFDRGAARAGAIAAVYLRRARVRIVASYARRVRVRAYARTRARRRVTRGRAPPRLA
ncbi:MAG: hypothetical protein NVSMB21_03510 [Vulcanimicrobiaceae bacterium]